MTNPESVAPASSIVKEIKGLDPKALVVLAGNKCDSDKSNLVKIGQAEKDLAKRLGVGHHFKISAKEGTNIEEMFEKVAQLLMEEK